MDHRNWDEASVLVPAISSPSAVAILRSLGRKGIHTIAASEDPKTPAYWSRYCDERIPIASPYEDLQGYRDGMLSVASRPDVHAITPLREADVYMLAKYRSSFTGHVKPLWPSSSRLEAVHDRKQLFAAADRADVPTPETRFLDEVDDWEGEHIVKARYAIIAGDYIESAPDGKLSNPPKTIFLEPGHEPDVAGIIEEMNHVPIIQEYVHGTEYCLRALYHDGEPIVTSQKRLVRGYKYPRGPSVFHESVDIERLREVGLALLDELHWTGLASVGFIRDSEGTFKLLEVNPRFWASLPMDVHAGIDYPGVYWQQSTNGSIDAEMNYRPGIASHHIPGELSHVHSVLFDSYPLVESPSGLGTIRNVIASMYTHPRYDYLSLDDPGPFVRAVANAALDTL